MEIAGEKVPPDESDAELLAATPTEPATFARSTPGIAADRTAEVTVSRAPRGRMRG